MKLSPSARRIIGFGISQLDDDSKRAWTKWVDRHRDGELTPDIIGVVVRGVAMVESHLLGVIAKRQFTEENEGDALNDLGFIRAIESDLRKERAHYASG